MLFSCLYMCSCHIAVTVSYYCLFLCSCHLLGCRIKISVIMSYSCLYLFLCHLLPRVYRFLCSCHLPGCRIKISVIMSYSCLYLFLCHLFPRLYRWFFFNNKWQLRFVWFLKRWGSHFISLSNLSFILDSKSFWNTNGMKCFWMKLLLLWKNRKIF